MSAVITWRCDRCGKEVSAGYPAGGLPASWFVVEGHIFHDRSLSAHYCSLACLKDWGREVLLKVDE